MEELDLVVIEARLAATTDGGVGWQTLWDAVESEAKGVGASHVVVAGSGDAPTDIAEVLTGRGDAEFIAHAPSDVRRLLAEIRRLRGQDPGAETHR